MPHKEVRMRSLLQLLLRCIDFISTRPDRKSWRWGKYLSVLAWLFLHAFWLARLISMLQIIKAAYRKVVILLHKADIDQRSKRPNIPPTTPEVYFTLWLFFFIFNSLLPCLHPTALYALSFYFMFESTCWILYYTVFRRFFEEKYSIYHPLEYFILLPLILASQVFALSTLFSANLKESFLVLIGMGGNSFPSYVNAFGVLYLAIVVSMIINSFPTETKKSDRDISIAIIGNGDVVNDRLLPVLKKLFPDSPLDIYSPDVECDSFQQTHSKHQISESTPDIKDIAKASIVWIATPSYAHLRYVQMLAPFHTQIVLEKPITSMAVEIPVLKSIRLTEIWSNIFCLSYYYLEKALPLTYLTKPYQAYRKYLCVKDKNDVCVKDEQLQSSYSSLGKLKGVTVFILEGPDKRDWSNKAEFGGQLLETFIHNVVIASTFAGLPHSWINTEWRSTSSTVHIELLATSAGASIHLIMAKGCSKENQVRGARVEFDNGLILASFETKEALILHRNDSTPIRIAVSPEYKQNYSVQTDLAISCFRNAALPSLIDGSVGQIDIIEWLLDAQANGLPWIDKLVAAESISICKKIETLFNDARARFGQANCT